MSYDQWLYKAEPGVGPITEWDSDKSVEIGSRSEIKTAMETIVGRLKWWEESTGCTSAHVNSSEYQFEIIISDSNVIRLKGCSHDQAIEIAKELGVCAFDPQDGTVHVS